MKELKAKIHQAAAAYHQELINIRRELHRHPELSKQEKNTAAFIASRLKEYGISFKSGVAGNGIVALIQGEAPGNHCVALRTDMDALPVHEASDVPFKSVNPGVMHACGHDVHMACLLGAGNILQQYRKDLRGSVKLIFQPSEEVFPGGAIGMIKEGVLENPRVDAIIGQHVIPTLHAGEVGMKEGKYMASTDEVYITVHGKGGHAATPEMVIDPILMASHIVVALQQIVSRNANPATPTVLSFGRIMGEGRTNIIPDTVSLEGTIRTFDEAWRAEIHRRIVEIAQSVAEGMKGTCEVNIVKGYPYLENNPEVTAKIRSAAIDYLGEDHVIALEQRMTAEDFAYFARQVPACFYRLGIRNEAKGIVHNLHTSRFDVDEESLVTGAGTLAYLAISLLNDLKR
ncbi:MAG: amidohydrolase [Bacteroidetes bacterium]|nr:amidohydrolase [Bacteroidota bacterium]